MSYHLAYLVGALLFDAAWVACYLIGKRYRPQIIWGTVVSAPRDFIQRYYNVPNLLGIYALGVPIEELLFAASGGAVWSIASEYLQGYRFASEGGFRLVEI